MRLAAGAPERAGRGEPDARWSMKDGPMHPASSKPAPANDNSQAVMRSVVSLLICVHLFCVAAVLASNSPGSYRRSPLQGRLVSVFAPYTRLLHFDPEFTPYYYTLGRPLDDDTRLVIDLYASGELPV